MTRVYGPRDKGAEIEMSLLSYWNNHNFYSPFVSLYCLFLGVLVMREKMLPRKITWPSQYCYVLWFQSQENNSYSVANGPDPSEMKFGVIPQANNHDQLRCLMKAMKIKNEKCKAVVIKTSYEHGSNYRNEE